MKGRVPSSATFLLPLLISVFAHIAGLIGWAGYFRFFRLSHPSAPKTELSLVEVFQPPKGTHFPRASGRLARGKLSLSDLGIRWNRNGGVALPSGMGGDPVAASGLLGSGAGTALEGIGLTVSLDRLRERVADALIYPREFLDEGIEGDAQVSYTFVPEEAFLPRKARVTCRSPYLRVYLLRLLARLWPEPLHASYFRRGALPVRFHFRFLLTDTENPIFNVESPVASPAVAGNALYFERKGKLIGSWKLGPFLGYGFAPAVGIDTDWIADRAQEILGQKERLDPLRVYRRDPLF